MSNSAEVVRDCGIVTEYDVSELIWQLVSLVMSRLPNVEENTKRGRAREKERARDDINDINRGADEGVCDL